MTHLGSAVHQLFARQHGVASIDQLIGAGLTHRQVEYLGHRGDLVSVIRGAYRTPSVALDELSRCAAVSLAHPLVAVSGPTAGRLWGFRRVSADRRIHVVAPRHWRATAATWCVAYRTDAIRREDVVERPDAIRVTSRARTALDLSRHLRSDDDLLSVIEQAAFDGGLRDGDLRAVAVDWAPRRPFVRRFLRQLDRRLANGAAESEPEVYVGEALRQAGVEGLVRQHHIDLPGYGAARFDLALPACRWALEVDVFPTHAETIGRRRDARRDAAASRCGWTVRRISAEEYRTDFDRAIASAVGDLRARRA